IQSNRKSGRSHAPSKGKPNTIVQPRIATAISSTAYRCNGRQRLIFDEAPIALPSANPAMKLERINVVAQTELPNAKPLKRNHSVSKINAPIPEKNSNPESTHNRIPDFVPRSKSFRARPGSPSTLIVDLANCRSVT